MPSYFLPHTKPHPDDTTERDMLDETMNEITRTYFGFILVKCPDCACINARNDDKELPCDSCKLPFQASDAPDLFF